MSSNNVTLKITNMPSICASMIVKNESNIICRFLDSIKTFVDYICICDTGSTDNTIEVIEKYFIENNLKGHVFSKEFVNFAENRNYALEESREYGDYILLLDADMKLVNSEKIDKTKLDGKGYSIKQCGGNLEYYNLRLVPSNIRSEYIGVTHEYLSFNGKTENLDDIYIDDRGDGGCKKDKFTRDEKLLRTGLQNDSGNTRYYFYLANTLRDLKKYDEAIKYYKERIGKGGWDEEIFYSHYQIGLCYEYMGPSHEAHMEKAYMDAWEIRPTRAEPLYHLAKYYRINGKHARSWAYAMVGKDIKLPNDRLFVHTDKYGVNFDREIAIVSYYIPIANKTHVLFKRIFQENVGMLDMSNYSFYRKTFIPDSRKNYSCKHTLKQEGFNINYTGSTPCIIPNKQGGYDFLIRMVNYSITNKGEYTGYEESNIVSSIYKKLSLGANLEINDQEDKYFTLDGIIGEPNNWGGKKLHGIEDMKIFYKNDSLKLIGNTCTKDRKISIVTGELMPTFSYNYLDMIDDHCEKNWCVIPRDDDKLQIVYKWHPLTIIEADMASGNVEIIKEMKMPAIFNFVRGSTNGCLYENNIFFLGHIVEHNSPRRYSNIVVKFDNKMDYVGCSYPFKLSDSSIEYCLGMIIEDDRIIFSYSENDASSKVAVINRERFFKEHWMH